MLAILGMVIAFLGICGLLFGVISVLYEVVSDYRVGDWNETVLILTISIITIVLGASLFGLGEYRISYYDNISLNQVLDNKIQAKSEVGLEIDKIIGELPEDVMSLYKDISINSKNMINTYPNIDIFEMLAIKIEHEKELNEDILEIKTKIINNETSMLRCKSHFPMNVFIKKK